VYIKVQLMNGRRAVDLFWIQHTGIDLYCGPSQSKLKWSYHEKGEYHVVHGRERLFTKIQAPLTEVSGYVPITGIGLPATPLATRIATATPQSSARRVDARVTIDERSLDRSLGVQVTVGVIRTDAFHLLADGLAKHAAMYPQSLSLHQLLVVASVSPWVVIAVYQAVKCT
jgi:hypothetical protein